jgi:uncharacterized membrane protein
MGHPLHPIFVTIPIGLWSFAPICDFVYLLGWGDSSWKAAAFYCIGGGIAGAVPAIITGWIDYSIVQGVKAATVAKFHLILNAAVSVLIPDQLWAALSGISGNVRFTPRDYNAGGGFSFGHFRLAWWRIGFSLRRFRAWS